MMSLPEKGSRPTRDNDDGNVDSGSLNLTIHGDAHFTPNDIAELRKLADEHPELANKIVDQRSKLATLDHNTERLGMALAIILGIALVAGTAFTLVKLGWLQSIMFVGALLGISHVLRTVLKGEFSDTSWFGQIMSGASKMQNADKNENES